MEGHCYKCNGRAIPANLTEKVSESAWNIEGQMEAFYQLQLPIPKGMKSAGDFLQQNFDEQIKSMPPEERNDTEAVYNCALKYIQFQNGENMNKVSLQHIGQYDTIPGGDVKVPGGLGSILRALNKSLPREAVHCGRTVNHIEMVKAGPEWKALRITCSDGNNYYADHVIVTCSLGYLKKHAQTLFSPPLPKLKVSAINHIGFGRSNKIFLEYTHPFWHPEDGGIKLGWTNEELISKSVDEWWKDIFAFDQVMNNPCVLVGWISGPGAKTMETRSDHEVGVKCTELIRTVLDNPSIPLPSRVIVSRWCSNPLTLGTYSYLSCDSSPEDITNLASPVRDDCQIPRIQFAGEATHPKWYSTMHGARSSGIREGQRLIEMYTKPSKL